MAEPSGNRRPSGVNNYSIFAFEIKSKGFQMIESKLTYPNTLANHVGCDFDQPVFDSTWRDREDEDTRFGRG